MAEGEKKAGRKNFATVSGLLMYVKEIPETTGAMGVMYPIIFRENTNKVEARFLYETPEYKRNLAGMRVLQAGNCCSRKYGVGNRIRITG